MYHFAIRTPRPIFIVPHQYQTHGLPSYPIFIVLQSPFSSNCAGAQCCIKREINLEVNLAMYHIVKTLPQVSHPSKFVAVRCWIKFVWIRFSSNIFTFFGVPCCIKWLRLRLSSNTRTQTINSQVKYCLVRPCKHGSRASSDRRFSWRCYVRQTDER